LSVAIDGSFVPPSYSPIEPRFTPRRRQLRDGPVADLAQHGQSGAQKRNRPSRHATSDSAWSSFTKPGERRTARATGRLPHLAAPELPPTYTVLQWTRDSCLSAFRTAAAPPAIPMCTLSRSSAPRVRTRSPRTAMRCR